MVAWLGGEGRGKDYKGVQGNFRDNRLFLILIVGMVLQVYNMSKLIKLDTLNILHINFASLKNFK